MRRLKSFEEYEQEGIIRKGREDYERAKSLILESERKIRSMNINLEKVGITEDNANEYAEQCYNILMFLIRAKLYSEGYSSSGIGAHEAEVAYLAKMGVSEKDVLAVDELRYLRNGLLYYGKAVDKEYAEKAINLVKRNHYKLRKLIKSS